ncbi:hypothetical protein [Sulfuricystis thermophila]|uniref:hypothetical protein n=1 Tax=Sulfuricystis thermophila TaxID=2496847 RepID=UPI0010364531|nr:hypothetical protein [Sulfuricystis thermophila]
MEANQKLTINSTELAQALNIPRVAFARHRSGLINHPLLRGLPEPLQQYPRLVWLRADINDWLASRRTFRPSDAPAQAPTPAPRRGRPRKERGAV